MPLYTFWTKALLYVALFIGLRVYWTAHAEKLVCLHSTSRIPLNLSCQRNHVIMSPNVMVGNMAGGLNSNEDCQYNSKRDCVGTTPEVIAQANECQFKQTCSITLNRYMPITSSANRSCLALRPDYAILYSHECVHRKSLHFLCRGRSGEQLIKRKEGVLVSHDAYPWHYQVYPVCIAYFAPKHDHRLSLWSEDLDIDPEGRDNLSLYNITLEGSTEPIGDPLKSSTLGFNITVPSTSSMVGIKFAIGKFTKSGRGFVIKFKWLPEGIREGPSATRGLPDGIPEEPTVNRESCRKADKKAKKRGKKRRNHKASHLTAARPSRARKTEGSHRQGTRRYGRKGKARKRPS